MPHRYHHYHLLAWIIALAIVVAIFVALRIRRRWVSRRTILEIDLERGVVERHPADLLSRFSGQRAIEIRDLVDALHRAAKDHRVAALIARIGPAKIGLAHAQEIRRAVEEFRAAGKRAVAWCETLGEGASATVEYHLACGFDEIHLQPSADLGIEALAIHQPFAREMLEKLGVVPRLDHRKEYKSAKYIFTEKEMPEPQRESLRTLLESWSEQITRGIATARNIDAARVREILTNGPYTAREALELKLVDRLGFRDEAYDQIKKQVNGKLLFLEKYLGKAGRPYRRGQSIAVIYGVGGVARGKSRSRKFPKSVVMGSDDVTAAFRKARESKKIAAIVFRVDSPGGSVVASESIWREVKLARESGKPVIVSMSNLAGSGGYFVAAPANKIVAEAGTITGSIGVVTGKMITAEAWKKLGINWGKVALSDDAGMWSSIEDFSPRQWEKLQKMLDAIYTDFKQKVAEGRKLTMEKVEEIAKGRIWTGEQARSNGLVDDLGGLDRAIDIAKAEANIPADKNVRIMILPKKKSWLQSVFGGKESSEAEMVEHLATIADPVLRILTDSPARDAVRMPWGN